MEDQQFHDLDVTPKHNNSKFTRGPRYEYLDTLDENVFEAADDNHFKVPIPNQQWRHAGTYDLAGIEDLSNNHKVSPDFTRQRQQNSIEDDERAVSRNEIRKKSKEMHHLLMGGSPRMTNNGREQQGSGNPAKNIPTTDVRGSPRMTNNGREQRGSGNPANNIPATDVGGSPRMTNNGREQRGSGNPAKNIPATDVGGSPRMTNNGREQHGSGNPAKNIPATDVGFVISDNVTNEKVAKDSRIKHKEKKSRDVTIVPDFSAVTGNETSGVVLCEKLFGIIVFQYSNGKVDWHQLPKDSKLVIQSIVEGSNNPALAKVQRGDMLVGINGEAVSWYNFNRLMSLVKKRERSTLTFQSPRIVGPKSSYRVIQAPEGDLCLAVLGKRLSHIQSELSHYPCVALFLTLSQSSSSSQSETDIMEDIIYAFPSEEETLTSLKGLFITLSSSMKDIVCQRATGSHLVLDEGKVNVAYCQCGHDVLVIAMPQSLISSSAVSNLLTAVYSLLVLLFADIKSAFINCDKLWLDRVLAILFHEALCLRSCLTSSSSSSSPSSSPLKNAIATSSRCTAVKTLPLSHDNKLICDEILCELESMEFDDCLDKEDIFSRRKYLIRGTSLFYKDYLLRSHLTKENQCDVNLFLQSHGLLLLSSREHVDQVFAWQELKSYDIYETLPSSPIGYQPYNTRTFFMLVGMRHYLLAVILETGDSSSVTMAGALYPSSLLMEQSKNTLSQLETPDVQMAKYCENRLKKMDEMIVLASVDNLCTTSSPRHRSGSDTSGMKKYAGSATKPPPTSTKVTQESQWKARSKSVETLNEGVESNFQNEVPSSVPMRREGSKMSFGSNDSAGSGSSSGHPKSKVSRVGSNTDVSSISRSVSVLQIPDPYCGIVNTRICRGREPAVFYFMAIDESEGVLICPTEAELSSASSPLQKEVIDNFYAACHRMQEIFTAESKQEEEDGTSLSANPFATPRLEPKEQGVLFECCFQSDSDKKSQISLQYWVVGRRLSRPSVQEMFVCFHESTQQSLVEMAFSLGFGT